MAQKTCLAMSSSPLCKHHWASAQSHRISIHNIYISRSSLYWFDHKTWALFPSQQHWDWLRAPNWSVLFRPSGWTLMPMKKNTWSWNLHVSDHLVVGVIRFVAVKALLSESVAIWKSALWPQRSLQEDPHGMISGRCITICYSWGCSCTWKSCKGESLSKTMPLVSAT